MMDLLTKFTEATAAPEQARESSTASQYRQHLPDPDEPLDNTELPARTPYAKDRSAKAPDPQKLVNGESPTFDHWEVEVHGKFEINADDHFESEKAKMYYVYSLTDGDAKETLVSTLPTKRRIPLRERSRDVGTPA
jgi:hypothetical protein